MEGRVRWLRASVLAQTAQSQAIIGTPAEVPEPRKVTVISGDTANLRSSRFQHGDAEVTEEDTEKRNALEPQTNAENAEIQKPNSWFSAFSVASP